MKKNLAFYEIILAVILITLILLPQLVGTTTVADNTEGVDENGCPQTSLTLEDLEAPGTRFGIMNIHEWEMEIKKRFGYEVGFSDHTIGNECAIAAVAMGASIVEKHVTLDKSLPGPDHKASIDIPELASLVSSIRHIEQAIGVPERMFSDAQREISRVARKSIVSKHVIKQGDVITADDICFKRPGIGFLPIETDKVIGKTALCDIEVDRVIKAEFIG